MPAAPELPLNLTPSPASREPTGWRALGPVPLALRVWIFTVVAIMLPVWLTVPFGRDQGIFAQIGTVILQGGLPFSDAWDVKGPLTHFMFAASFLLFGSHEFSFNLLFLLLFFPTLVIACAYLRAWTGAASGILAALLLLNKSALAFWYLGQPDSVIACLAVWVTCLSSGHRSRMNTRRTFVLGILCASAAWIKPPFALLAMTPLLGLVMSFRSQWKALLRQMVFFFAGVILVTMAMVLPYLWKGSFGALWEVMIHFNLSSHLDHARPDRWPSPLPHFVNDRWGRIFFNYSMLKIAGALLMIIRMPSRGVLLGCSTLACYLAAGVQGKFWVQHFFAYEFIGMLFAAYFLTLLLQVLSDRKHRSASFAAAAIFVFCLRPCLYVQCRAVEDRGIQWWLNAAGQLDKEDWDRQFNWDGGFNLASLKDAAAAIQAHSNPGDPMYLWGFDALLYFYADRPCSSRFSHSYPAMTGDESYMANCRAEILQALSARPPRIIAVQERDANPLYSFTSREKLAEFEGLNSLIVTHYREIHRNADFTLYLRNQP